MTYWLVKWVQATLSAATLVFYQGLAVTKDVSKQFFPLSQRSLHQKCHYSPFQGADFHTINRQQLDRIFKTNADSCWFKKSNTAVFCCVFLIFPVRNAKHKQISLTFVTYSYFCGLSSARLCSDQLVDVLWHFSVDNREVADCPLVDKLCNISTHSMAEGGFFHLFYT